METTYRVRTIRSKTACEREGYEYPHIEENLVDTNSLDEALDAYNSAKIGAEVDKEMINLDTDEVLMSTY